MRPDFGSGLLGARVRARRAGARGHDPAPRPGRAAAGARPPDRGRVGRGDAGRRRPLGHRRATSRSRRRRARSALVREERAVIVRAAATSAACARSRRPASSTGSSTSRSPTPRRRPRRCASARCSSGCCSRRRRSPPTNVTIIGRRADPDGRDRVDRACDRAARRRGSRARRRTRGPGRPCCSSAPTSRGDFSRYTLRLVAGAGSDDAARRLRPAARRGRLLVQGRVPVRLRLRAATATARPTPAEAPAIDYLAKDYASFRRLMLDRLSLLAPGVDGADAGRRRHRARRAARLRRRRALVPPGRGRDRGLPRHRAPAHLAAAARAARRLPRPRGLQRARLGARSSSAARASRSTAARRCSRASPDVPAVIEPGGPEHRAALAARRRDVRDGRGGGPLRLATSASTSGRGATPAAACRAARPRPRSSATIPS